MKNYLETKDYSICKIHEDSLKLGYTAARLIVHNIYLNCLNDYGAPRIIGIQRDLAIGKTSIMNMAKHLLKKDNKIKCIWINTWQYAHFNMESPLALSLISKLVEDTQEQLSNDLKDRAKEVVDKSLKILKKFTGFAFRIGDGTLTQGALDPSIEGDAPKNDSNFDPSECLKELKLNLENFITTIVGSPKNPIEKFVIFFDDLDRIKPQKAVELLETLKLFLEIDGCIFVLTCDYKIIMKVLKEKYGVHPTNVCLVL